jgi:NADH-quinone oxidoreductase subunit K
MPVLLPLVVSSLLFSIGVYVVLARRHAILVLMGVELMLNAVNLDLVTFDAYWHDTLHAGQSLSLFVIVIAAAEIGLGLAIVLLVFRTHRHIAIGDLRELADRDEQPGCGAQGVPAAVEGDDHVVTR